MKTPETEKNEEICLENLAEDRSVLTLGALVVAELAQHGVITLYLSNENRVELAAPGELGLDVLPEAEAIGELAAQHVPDEQIELYLRGRDSRLARTLARIETGIDD